MGWSDGGGIELGSSARRWQLSLRSGKFPWEEKLPTEMVFLMVSFEQSV